MLTTNPFDDDKLREECGVFGIWGGERAASFVALGLHALQHRGQESAGIVAVSEGIHDASGNEDGFCIFPDGSKLSTGALEQYGMLVVPGAEVTQNRIRGRKNSHIIALDLRDYISADQSAAEIVEYRQQARTPDHNERLASTNPVARHRWRAETRPRRARPPLPNLRALRTGLPR